MSLSRGYTIFEILFTLALIGLIVGMLFRASPDRALTEWQAIPDRLNSLLFFAQEQALVTHSTHQLTFYKKPNGKDSVVLMRQVEHPDKKFTMTFEPVDPLTLATVELPEQARWGKITDGKKNLFRENDREAHVVVSTVGTFDPVTIELQGTFDDLTFKEELVLEAFLGQVNRKQNAS